MKRNREAALLELTVAPNRQRFTPCCKMVNIWSQACWDCEFPHAILWHGASVKTTRTEKAPSPTSNSSL